MNTNSFLKAMQLNIFKINKYKSYFIYIYMSVLSIGKKQNKLIIHISEINRD